MCIRDRAGTESLTCDLNFIVNSVTVSYTHLDVYKRQVFIPPFLLIFGHLIMKLNSVKYIFMLSGAVSYTHLDVYKRQVIPIISFFLLSLNLFLWKYVFILNFTCTLLTFPKYYINMRSMLQFGRQQWGDLVQWQKLNTTRLKPQKESINAASSSYPMLWEYVVMVVPYC